MSPQKLKAKAPSSPKSLLELHVGDEARFIRSWLENPMMAGAIAPSGRFLARAMAQCVDLSQQGPIVELGPGTGPVTRALLARGVAPEKLILIEYEPSFCALLAKKFPGVKILRGDAYRLADTLGDALDAAPSTVVSSLPLLTRPEAERIALLREAFALMGPEGKFIQFTYGVKSPVPLHLASAARIAAETLAPIWLNLPPARVFVYRSATPADQRRAARQRADVIAQLARQSRRFAREIHAEWKEARARIAAQD